MISKLLRQRLKADSESEEERLQNEILTVMKGARHCFSGADDLWPSLCEIAVEFHFKEHERPHKHELLQIFYLDDPTGFSSSTTALPKVPFKINFQDADPKQQLKTCAFSKKSPKMCYAKGGNGFISYCDIDNPNDGTQTWGKRLKTLHSDERDCSKAICCVSEKSWWWNFDYNPPIDISNAPQLSNGLLTKAMVIGSAGHEIVPTMGSHSTDPHRDTNGRIKYSHIPELPFSDLGFKIQYTSTTSDPRACEELEKALTPLYNVKCQTCRDLHPGDFNRCSSCQKDRNTQYLRLVLQLHQEGKLTIHVFFPGEVHVHCGNSVHGVFTCLTGRIEDNPLGIMASVGYTFISFSFYLSFSFSHPFICRYTFITFEKFQEFCYNKRHTPEFADINGYLVPCTLGKFITQAADLIGFPTKANKGGKGGKKGKKNDIDLVIERVKNYIDSKLKEEIAHGQRVNSKRGTKKRKRDQGGLFISTKKQVDSSSSSSSSSPSSLKDE